MATSKYCSKCNKDVLYFVFNTSYILVGKKIKTLIDRWGKDIHKRSNGTSKQRFEMFSSQRIKNVN